MTNTEPDLTQNPAKPAIKDDHVKNPDQARDANKTNPDNDKAKGDKCGC